MQTAAARIFLLVFLAMASIAFAQISPFTVSQAVSTIVEEGTISVSGGSFREVQLNVSLPQPGSSQKTAFDSSYAVYTDSDGNVRATVSKTTKERAFDYKIESTVETNAISTTGLPGSFVSPSEYGRYLASSQKVQSGDAAIRELALQITENATGQFEKVARIAIWVNSNLEYQTELVGQENDALWVLQNRRGVCVEYTTLFIALSRSIGIPARYVTGYAYANKFNAWLGHAWAEAYIGKWVPVDPTWLEVGNLDAMHIATSRSDYLKPDLLVSALVYPPEAKLIINRKGERGGVSDAVKTGRISAFPEDVDYEFDASAQEAGIGDRMLVWMYRVSGDYRVLPALMSECKGGPFEVLSEADQNLIMEPGKGRVAAWEVTTPPELSKRFVYTCPLVLNSAYLGPGRLNLTVSNAKKLGPELDAWAENRRVPLGQTQRIYVRGKALLFGLKLITPEGIYENPRTEGDLGIFAIKPEIAGPHTVYVIAKGRNYRKIEYDVEKENGTIFIENYSIPRFAFESIPFRFSVTVASKAQLPRHVQLTASLGEEEVSKSGLVQGSTVFEFELVPAKGGASQLEMEIESEGVRDLKTYPVDVLVPPKVLISNVEQQAAEKGQKVTIILTRQGEPFDVSVSLGSYSQQVPADSDRVSFEVAAGKHPLLIRWEDESGKGYQLTDTLEVKNTSAALPFLPSAGGGEGGSPKCLAAMLMAGIAAFVFSRA